MSFLRYFILVMWFPLLVSAQEHLLISEFVVTPTAGEFIEIHNPTASPIDLSNYYLTDATHPGNGFYYYKIVTGSDAGGGSLGDFHARFPEGAVIAPGEYQTIAMHGSNFITTYGVSPGYELFNTDPAIPDMREALPGSINNQGGLSNDGEVIILYFWNGESDLVQDVDYAVWGDKVEAVDKSGVSIDGPDPNSDPSTYLDDTPIPQQISVSGADPHVNGQSVQRSDATENGENQSGGNGVSGHDETSEDLAASFRPNLPTPNGAPPASDPPQVSNVNHTPATPFPGDAVTVTATVTDDGTLVSVFMFYSADNSPFDSTAMNVATGNTYSATIAPQPSGAVVRYYVKARDNDNLVTTSPTNSYTVAVVTSIADIQANPAGFTNVTVEGVVTLGAGKTIATRTDAYIQDNSGRGINLFDFDPPNPADRIDRGNRLRVSGTIAEFGGVTEITNYTVSFVSAGNPLPDPLYVSSVIANDLTYEGTYMRVVGVAEDIASGVGGGTNITVRDDKGTVLARVWDITGINLGFLRAGDSIAVQGVMDVFNNASQLIPAYQDEITIPGQTARADGSGIASLSVAAVDTNQTLQNFTVSLVGTIEDPITTLRIDLPQLWQWSGNPAEVALEGNGLEDAAVEVQTDPFDRVHQVLIRNTSITSPDTAKIVFNNLATPAEPVTSVFWVRTAGEGGRLQLINVSPRLSVAGGERYLIYDLQTNSAAFPGTITVRGVTTIGAGKLREVSSANDSLTTAYIQDESGRGINLFRFGLIQPELVRGNLVEARGVVTEFNGVTEVEYTQITLLAEGLPTPEPLRLTNAQVNSPRWDGTLVTTEGVIVERFSAGNGTTLEISDGRGKTNVRIWDTARLDLSEFNENTRIFVEGVGSLFLDDGDSIFQILPVYQDQLEVDPNYAPSIEDVALKVEPHPFAPDRGETIEISYNAAAVNNQVTLRIFDLGGRLVTTLLDEAAEVIENTFTWDGRDRRNERVPLGAYVCHLKVVEPVSAKTKIKMAPIVVGTVLK